jgi:exodeoxyribonuclease VII large subunit
VALRGRQLDELAHRLAGAARGAAGRRRRRLYELRLRLEALDLGRRLAAIRARLAAARGGLEAAMEARQRAHEARVRVAAGRLDTLSPLGVLARGYAVCWTGDRAAIIRDAAAAAPGQAVHVKLHRGALDCEVTRVE